MSNLGMYEKMTTVASKVGGPKNLFTIVAVGGALIGSLATEGINIVTNKIIANRKKKYSNALSSVLHTVHTGANSKEGLTIKEGEQFKILEQYGNSALIEIIGKENNPYLVSKEFLQSISDC